MKTQCPHCQRLRELPDAYAGRAVKCPDCGHPHTLAAYTPPPPPEPEIIVAAKPAVPTPPPVEYPPSGGLPAAIYGGLLIAGGAVIGIAAQSVVVAVGGIVGGLILMAIGDALDYLAKIAWYLEKKHERNSKKIKN